MSINYIIFLSLIYSISALTTKVSELGPFKVLFNLQKIDELFDDFVQTYHKNYSDEHEYRHRFKIFKKNVVEINKLNDRSNSTVFSINELSDLSPEELVGNFTIPPAVPDEIENMDNDTAELVRLRSTNELPKEWDWRKRNVVTPPKNQGKCQSCWAFASVACIESQHAIRTNKLVPLSQQQLVDCLGHGCNPYYPDRAMREVAAKMGGLMNYADYPYVSASNQYGRCLFNKTKVAVKIRGGVHVNNVRHEEQLKQLVYKYGPVVVAIFASDAFWYFRGGVAAAESLKCRHNAQPNHAVVIVGYGIENNVPYWIIKNSGGTSWGENGYMKLLQGQNACNILRYISIAQF